MLSPEFIILFHLHNNNCTIDSLRSTGLHPQKAKNAIKNLIDIGLIQDLGNGTYGIYENISNIDAIEENILLRRKFFALKFIIKQKIDSDIRAFEELENTTIGTDFKKMYE